MFLDEIGELGADEQAMLLRAIEMKTFLPVGSDKEETSDFQLIAGTNRALYDSRGGFREDLLARLDLWTFELPGLADRPEDIEPNIDFELERVGESLGSLVRFNAAGRARFLEFALKAPWPRNFRDFGAAIRRMATLTQGARIGPGEVDAEIERLQRRWGQRSGQQTVVGSDGLRQLVGDRALDPFDRVQLEEVIRVCRSADSLSAAGRTLFCESRKRRATVNDSDRLRKYLAKWGIQFQQI